MDPRQKLKYKGGRGAQKEVHNRFDKWQHHVDPEHLEHLYAHDEDPSQSKKTSYLKIYPKSIINPVSSPDLPFSWSMNPYQGCEHGCAYCYARNTHEYWGYKAGIDFEQRILVKEKASKLLEAALQKKKWIGEPIMLSGNTDCYQPIESKKRITRAMLEVCLKYGQPLGIITKNSLILRDLDILTQMAEKGLVRVVLSITTMDEGLRRKLEPRTSSISNKLSAIDKLSKAGIPTGVMMAPIIPGLNSHEIFNLAKATSQKGALSFSHTILRLNGIIGEVFLDWMEHHYPDRLKKVKHLVESTHGGRLNDSQFGRRMKGDGNIAQQINGMLKLARRQYFHDRSMPEFNRTVFVKAPKGQLKMF